MRRSQRPEPGSRSDAVTETALVPILALSAALLTSWSLWALVIHPAIPAPSETAAAIIGIAARSIFWLLPCAGYLWRYWGSRWHQPLGLGFPLGAPQVVRTLVLTVVVAALLLWGTSLQLGVGLPMLAARLATQARPAFSAPLFEELVFRGLLLGELINWARDSSTSPATLRARFWAGLLLSSIVFTLVHWPWWASHFGWSSTLERSGPVLVTGVVLGFVFANTRSVWACVLLHWLNNQLSGIG